MESGKNDDRTLRDFSEMYQDAKDNEVEQSAIFRKVYFWSLKDNIFAVVLTPVCDIYRTKADFINLVGLVPARALFRQWLIKQQNPPTEKQIAGLETFSKERTVTSFHKGFLSDVIGQKEIRYHFLPAYKDVLPYLFADFQLMQSIKVAQFTKCKKVVTLNSPWREALSQRYSAYCGRVGTKPYSNELKKGIMATISNLKPKTQ